MHYGHSCLVPIHETKGINLLYIFVNIDINLTHFLDTLRNNFSKEKKLAIVSTIQFVASLQVFYYFEYSKFFIIKHKKKLKRVFIYNFKKKFRP